jgi:hypothetical protein
MIELDSADLVVIAGQVLGIGTDAALSQLDIATASADLAEARLTGREAASAAARSRRPGSTPTPPHRAAAAAAAVALMPRPRTRESQPRGRAPNIAQGHR